MLTSKHWERSRHRGFYLRIYGIYRESNASISKDNEELDCILSAADHVEMEQVTSQPEPTAELIGDVGSPTNDVGIIEGLALRVESDRVLQVREGTCQGPSPCCSYGDVCVLCSCVSVCKTTCRHTFDTSRNIVFYPQLKVLKKQD